MGQKQEVKYDNSFPIYIRNKNGSCKTGTLHTQGFPFFG